MRLVFPRARLECPRCGLTVDIVHLGAKYGREILQANRALFIVYVLTGDLKQH